MGYDRAITIFSPEGKLYQVEYAFEAVRRGWLTIGMKCKEGTVVVVEKKKIETFIELDSIEKIFQIDDHIAASFAGLAADGRILIDFARLTAIRYRFTYDEPPDVEYIVRAISDVKQAYTQHAGVRPFGVALIVIGVDDKGPHVFRTEPSGQYMSYYAVAIGQNSETVMEFLERKYKYEMSLDELIKLGVQALLSVAPEEEKYTEENVEVGVVPVDTRKFRKLSKEEVKRILDELGQK